MRVASLLRGAVVLALAVPGLGCLYLFHELYWRRRGCFNELGRCFDPISVTVYTDDAAIWGVAGGVLLAAAALVYASGRSRRTS